ncbi:MAG: hypothetical protein PHS93_09220 [Candidatus Omnitrophica bacterium]|nr:hypothetical protein [Candidatus Omnitrophota bacterium]MDD5353326.1 hypothetical protein [Candidatus Omnitrophota bacterium]MDD5551406.1 hypothetical protein [Candidatus Omnitrophota bacterium]
MAQEIFDTKLIQLLWQADAWHFVSADEIYLGFAASGCTSTISPKWAICKIENAGKIGSTGTRKWAGGCKDKIYPFDNYATLTYKFLI